jgi:putative lipoic acid-binding regulatory protein
METTEGRIGEGLTFEKVWAAIQAANEQLQAEKEEMRAQAQANMEEIQAQLRADREQIEATWKQIRATDEQMKNTDKRLGELTNRFGDMVEHMALPNLVTKFDELGFIFTRANRTEIKDRQHNLFMEIDALLENGDKVMAVEIKTKPSIEDINDHIERMEKLRIYADLHNDKRVYLAAMAGVVFSESEKTYALKKGLYIVEPSGDTFRITKPEGKYYPHEW